MDKGSLNALLYLFEEITLKGYLRTTAVHYAEVSLAPGSVLFQMHALQTLTDYCPLQHHYSLNSTHHRIHTVHRIYRVAAVNS